MSPDRTNWISIVNGTLNSSPEQNLEVFEILSPTRDEQFVDFVAHSYHGVGIGLRYINFVMHGKENGWRAKICMNIAKKGSQKLILNLKVLVYSIGNLF